MIKGINKQILEVTSTESPYFEKIIFFVKPQAQSTSPEVLNAEAAKISSKMRKPPKCKKTKSQILSFILYSAMGIAAGTAITFVLNNLF